MKTKLKMSTAVVSAAAALSLTVGADVASAGTFRGENDLGEVRHAAPSPPEAADTNCFTKHDNNGEKWTKFVVVDNAVNGGATWYERGDKLLVRDNSSNGLRTVVNFSFCKNGNWTPDGKYKFDSGPDEGEVDEEVYDFTMVERRMVRFQACETDGLHPYHCSNTVWANA
jgi:hypothetical protein